MANKPKQKGNTKIVGNLWKDLSDAQKKAGVVLTGSIEGFGRVTVFKRKEKRPGKQDSDFYIVADASPAPEAAEASDEDSDGNPF